MTEVTAGDYDAVLGLNLNSAFFVAQAAASADRTARSTAPPNGRPKA